MSDGKLEEEQVITVARQIVDLISSLDDLEQKAVLEMADTLRAYKTASRARSVYQAAADVGGKR